MACKGDPTKSGYLTFDPGGVSTINWWLNRGQVSEYSRSTKVKPCPDTNKKPNDLSNIPFLEESCNRLTSTTILRESQTIKILKRLT